MWIQIRYMFLFGQIFLRSLFHVFQEVLTNFWCQGEFLCPVCRRLANSVLPVLHGEVPKGVGSTDTPSPLAPLNEEAYSLHLQQALDLLKSAALAVRNGEFIKAFPLQRNAKVRPNLEPVTRMLYKMYFPGKQDKFFGSSRVNQSMIMWDTLKYSLVSTEIAARCGRKSLTPVLRLNSMYRELNSSSGFILSLLLKIVKSTRSKNSLHVIQRFRGIQLLAGAICSGISLDHSSNKTGHSGIISLSSDFIHISLRLFSFTIFTIKKRKIKSNGVYLVCLIFLVFC